MSDGEMVQPEEDNKSCDVTTSPPARAPDEMSCLIGTPAREFMSLRPLLPYKQKERSVPMDRIQAAIETVVKNARGIPIVVQFRRVQSMSTPDASFEPPTFNCIRAVLKQTSKPHWYVEFYANDAHLTPRTK